MGGDWGRTSDIGRLGNKPSLLKSTCAPRPVPVPVPLTPTPESDNRAGLVLGGGEGDERISGPGAGGGSGLSRSTSCTSSTSSERVGAAGDSALAGGAVDNGEGVCSVASSSA